LLAKFTFPTIASCSTLRIGPYLFYIEKFTTQFNTTEKKMIGHHARFGENDDLPLWRGPAAKKKPPFFNAPALITRKIMRSRMRNAILGNNLKVPSVVLQQGNTVPFPASQASFPILPMGIQTLMITADRQWE